MNKTAEIGDTLVLHYSLCFENGELIETTEDKGAISLVLGDGDMDAGLEQRLIGLQEDVQAEFLIEAGSAFGDVDAVNVHPIPRDDFQEENLPEPGYVLSFTTPNGEEIPGTIMEIDDEFVVVDFNHPLAGKDLIFKVKVESIKSPD